MKRLFSSKLMSILIFPLLLLAASGHERVFKGEIADTQCALNVHSLSRSHKEMLKTHSMGSTAADCSRYCVQHMGGAFVLQVGDKVHKLDHQEMAEKHAGQKVNIAGDLDPKTNTIHVRAMEAQ